MADPESALENGRSFGLGIIQQGFDQYWKKKEFQERVAERSQQRDDLRAYRKSASDYKKGELEHRNKQEADMAAHRSGELDRQKARDAAQERHWRMEEEIARRKADNVGRGRGAGGKEMTPAQATSALREIDSMYGKKDAPPIDSSTWHRREKFKEIQDPDYEPRPFPGTPPSGWWWDRKPGEPADGQGGGSGLPGLE